MRVFKKDKRLVVAIELTTCSNIGGVTLLIADVRKCDFPSIL